MAIPHAAPGQLISVSTADQTASPEDSETLIRTAHLEVFRYAPPVGKALDGRTAAGTLIVQCLEGSVEFTALGRTQTLRPGTMLYLEDGEEHSIKALVPSLLLVTLLLNRA